MIKTSIGGFNPEYPLRTKDFFRFHGFSWKKWPNIGLVPPWKSWIRH